MSRGALLRYYSGVNEIMVGAGSLEGGYAKLLKPIERIPVFGPSVLVREGTERELLVLVRTRREKSGNAHGGCLEYWV